MRKTLILAISIVVATSLPVSAQFLGHLRSAEVSGMGSLNLLAGAGIYEDAFGILGRVRYGLAQPIDGTISLAFLDHESSDDLSFVIGGDLQFQITQTDLGKTLDIALGPSLEYFSLNLRDGSDFSDLAIGGFVIGSKPVRTDTGFKFTPYGKLSLRVDRVQRGRFSRSDSEFNIGFNLGSVFPLSSSLQVSTELQIDDQFGFIVGLNFFMW